MLDTDKEVGLNVNADKTNSRHHNTGQNHNIKYKFFGNEVKFKQLATTVSNQNCIHEKATPC
jgi:hypothetical protein